MTRLRALGAALWWVVACGDDDSSHGAREDATVADASTPHDAAPSLDARTVPGDASQGDAGQGAAGQGDAGASDAADAGMPTQLTLRQVVCGDQTSWPNPLPAMNMRSATIVKDGFGFIEGPVWVRALDRLLFSDMDFDGSDTLGPPSQIRRLDPPSTFDVIQPSSGSNGLALFATTTVLAATHDTRSLAFFDATSGARTDVAVTYQGKKFNSPNDLAIREDGWVYFTDPDWQLGARSSELKTAVYRVKLTATTPSAAALLVDDTQDKPNGIALSPDQKTLYVGSAGNEIYKWTVAADGSVSNRTSFTQLGGGSDGLTVDCAGNLYVTSGSVQVFAPNGAKLGTITVPNSSNVAFGGPDAKTLYITAQDSLYAIDLNVPGFPY
jgi:gluconolactonase